MKALLGVSLVVLAFSACKQANTPQSSKAKEADMEKVEAVSYEELLKKDQFSCAGTYDEDKKFTVVLVKKEEAYEATLIVNKMTSGLTAIGVYTATVTGAKLSGEEFKLDLSRNTLSASSNKESLATFIRGASVICH